MPTEFYDRMKDGFESGYGQGPSGPGGGGGFIIGICLVILYLIYNICIWIYDFFANIFG